MSRAYVVGEKSEILGFKGVGFEVVHADSAESLSRVLAELIRNYDASIVLVSETLARECRETLANFREHSSAIITTIPTHKGSAHQELAVMRRLVEHSIGLDMLGKD